MANTCEWHRCKMGDARWEDESSLPYDEKADGCTEWHTCAYCAEVIDVDDTPDFPYVVGRGFEFGGECFRTLETAEEAARRGLATNTVVVWKSGKTEWVPDVGDVSHPTIVAVYRNGKKLDAHLEYALHALREVARVGKADVSGFNGLDDLGELWKGRYVAKLVLNVVENLEKKLGQTKETA